ncbi:MAG: hypothetical protein PHY47_12615 [Lachnospiraceae bacterium]|nr:hypothetical protein [Lachnospiraceae bacterium]
MPYRNKYFGGSFGNKYFNIPQYDASVGRKINVLEGQLNRMGVKPPPMVKRGVTDRIFDALNVGQFTVMNILKDMTDSTPGFDIGESAIKGLRAANPFGQGYEEGEAQFSDVLSNLGWNPKSGTGKFAKGAVGFVGDVALDPLNYVTLGLKDVIKGTTKGASKIMPEAYKESIEKLTKGGAADILKKFNQSDELAEGLVSKVRRLAGEDFSKSEGMKLFGKTIFDSDTLQKFGDKTIAPYTSKYFNKISDSMSGIGSKIKNVFVSEESQRLRKAARETPELVANILGFTMQQKDLVKSFAKMQYDFAEKAIEMFDGIPEHLQKVMTDVLENEKSWSTITEKISSGTTTELTGKANDFYQGLIMIKNKYSDLLDKYNAMPGLQSNIDEAQGILDNINNILKSRAKTYEGLIKKTSDVLTPLRSMDKDNLYSFLNEFVNENANSIYGTLKNKDLFGLNDETYRNMSYEIRALLDKYQGENISEITRKFYKDTTYKNQIRNIENIKGAKLYFNPKQLMDGTDEIALRKATVTQLYEEGKKLNKIADAVSNVLDDNTTYDEAYETIFGKKLTPLEAKTKVTDMKSKSFVFDERNIRAMLATEGYTEEQINTIFDRVTDKKRFTNKQYSNEEIKNVYFGLNKNRKGNIVDIKDSIIKGDERNAAEVALTRQYDTGIDNADAIESIRKEISMSKQGKGVYADQEHILEKIRRQAESLYNEKGYTKNEVQTYISKEIDKYGYNQNDYLKFIGKSKKKSTLFDYYDDKLKAKLRLGQKDLTLLNINNQKQYFKNNTSTKNINDLIANKKLQIVDILDNLGVKSDDVTKHFVNSVEAHEMIDIAVDGGLKYEDAVKYAYKDYYQRYSGKIRSLEPKYFDGAVTENVVAKTGKAKKVIYDNYDIHGVKVSVERGAKISADTITKNIEDISKVNNKFAKTLTDLRIHVINSDEAREGVIVGRNIVLPNSKSANRTKVVFNHEFGHHMQDILGIAGDYEEFANAFGEYLINPSKFSDFAQRNPELYKKISNGVTNFEPTRQQYINLHASKIKEAAYANIETGKESVEKILANNKEEFRKIKDIIDTEKLSKDEVVDLLAKSNDEVGNWTVVFNQKYPEEAVYENVEQFLEQNRKKFKEHLIGFTDKENIEVIETVLNDFLRWGADEGIPDERLLSAYAPHMQSSKLKNVDPKKLAEVKSKSIIKGTQEEKFRLANMFALERKHPGTIQEINRYMKKEYGIDEWFEHRLGQLYLQRGLKHNQLMFDKQFYSDLSTHFGTKIDDITKIPTNRKMFASIEDIGEILALVDEKDLSDVIKDLGLPQKLMTDHFTPLVEIDANALVKLKTMNSKFSAMSVDNTVFDMINKMGKVQYDDTRSTFLKMYDKALGLWKLNATSINPGFHARNAISNVFQEYLAVGNAALDIETQALAYKIVAASSDKIDLDEVFKFGNKSFTVRELKELAIKLDVIDEGFWKTELLDKGIVNSNPLERLYSDIANKNKASKEAYTLTDKISKSPLNLLSKSFAPYQVGSAVGSAVEGQARLANFIANLKLGKDPFEAADMVQKFMFDYTDLSKIEKDVFKRIIPFYTWMRKNIPLQLEQLIDQPKTYRNLSKMLSTVKGLTPNKDRISRQDMNEFAREWIQLPFKTKNAKGKAEPVFWNPNLPYSDLDRADIFNPLEAAKDVFSSASPFIKLPVEILANKNVYFDSPISRGIGDTSDAPGYLNALLGGTKKDKAQIDPYLRYILQNIGSLENVSKLIEKSSDRVEGQIMSDKAIAALNALGGVKLYSYDVDKYREWALRDRLKQLRDIKKREEKKTKLKSLR